MSMEVDHKEATDQSTDHEMVNPQIENVITTSINTQGTHKGAEELTGDNPQKNELDHANADCDANRSDSDVTVQHETADLQSEFPSATENKQQIIGADTDQQQSEKNVENEINGADCDKRGSDDDVNVKNETKELQLESSSATESKPEIAGDVYHPNTEENESNDVKSSTCDRRGSDDATEQTEIVESQSATEIKTETIEALVNQPESDENRNNEDTNSDYDRRSDGDVTDRIESVESQSDLPSSPESKAETVTTEEQQNNDEERFNKTIDVNGYDEYDTRGSESGVTGQTDLESKQETYSTNVDETDSEEHIIKESETNNVNDRRGNEDDVTEETETELTFVTESKTEIVEAVEEQPVTKENEENNINDTDTETHLTPAPENQPEIKEAVVEHQNSQENEIKDENNTDYDTERFEDDLTSQIETVELHQGASSPVIEDDSKPVETESEQTDSEDEVPEEDDKRESGVHVAEQTETVELNSEVSSPPEDHSKPVETEVQHPHTEDKSSEKNDRKESDGDVINHIEAAEGHSKTDETEVQSPYSEDQISEKNDTKESVGDVINPTEAVQDNSKPLEEEVEHPHSEDHIPEKNDRKESDGGLIDQNEAQLEISSAPESNLKPAELNHPNSEEQYSEEKDLKDVIGTDEQEDKDETTTEHTEALYTLRTESEIVTFSPTPDEDQRGRESVSPVGEDRAPTPGTMPGSTENAAQPKAPVGEDRAPTPGTMPGSTENAAQPKAPVGEDRAPTPGTMLGSMDKEAQPKANTSRTAPPTHDEHSGSSAGNKIHKSMQSVNEMKKDLQNLFSHADELLKTYNKKLNSEPLKEFVHELDGFREDFDSLKEVYTECEDVSNTINTELKVLRQTTSDICNLINRKFREEDLSNWVDLDPEAESRKDQLKEERKAHEKAAQAKASQARAEAAKAATSVTESNQFASQAEAEAIEAELAAKTARDLADDAVRAAEQAKLAAEAKRKVEEEAKRKAKEREEQKAEEERKKREEEERQIAEQAKQKGTSIESERQRKAHEKQLREAEKKNPKNWPRYIYSTDGGDYDPGIGCIIRAMEGSLLRDDVEVTRLEQLSGLLELHGNEELISNIIEVTPIDKEKTFKFEEPFSLAIPHCAPRSGLGREPVIKMLNKDHHWVELQTHDAYFEDIKEMRFVETRMKRFGIFVVIYRIKRDSLTLSHLGGKVISSVDTRVSFTTKSLGKKINTNFTLEVQHVDQAIVQDLHYRKPTECAALITCSPIINLKVNGNTFRKPVTMTLPVPHNPSRIKRPVTSITRAKQGAETNGRPQTAKPTPFDKEDAEEATDQIHLFSKIDDDWVTIHHIPLIQPKKKDIVTFELAEPFERFFIIRTKVEITALQLEKLPPLIEEAVTLRSVKLFLRQQSRDLQNIIISCANSNKVDKVLHNLAEGGFDDGPSPSRDILVQEGQVMQIGFRGNLKPETNDFSTTFVFNSYIPSKINFRVVEVDRFAQKGIDSYRGFAQIFTKALVPKMISLDERDKSRGSAQAYKPPGPEMMEGHLLLCDLLMSIPKPEPEPPKPLKTAPVLLKSEGPVNNDMLWHIAQEIGDDWKKLAQYLCVKRMRIQAIMRQHVNDDNTKKIYDMLATWSKRLPTSIDRVDMLCYALSSCGRGDLSIELQQKRDEFKRQRAYSARASYLHKAFVRISKEPRVTGNWRVLGRRLGLNEEEMNDIERAKQTSHDRCYCSLQRWREHQGDEATLALLSNSLRQARYRGLAREIQMVS